MEHNAEQDTDSTKVYSHLLKLITIGGFISAHIPPHQTTWVACIKNLQRIPRLQDAPEALLASCSRDSKVVQASAAAAVIS